MVMSGCALASYETACQALAEVRTVAEARDIHDKAVAMAAYARLAKNRELEADAIEIRIRATRRMDQMRMAQKQSIGLAKPGRKKNGLRENPIPTLASQGLDENSPIKRACSAPWMMPRSSARSPRRGMAFSAALSAKPRFCSPSRSPTRPSASARPRAGQGGNAPRQAKNAKYEGRPPGWQPCLSGGEGKSQCRAVLRCQNL